MFSYIFRSVSAPRHSQLVKLCFSHHLHQLHHQELTLKRTRPAEQRPAEQRPAEDRLSSAGPLLPFAAALPEAPPSKASDGDAWGVTAREAQAQDVLLGEGEPLEVSENPLQDLVRKLG